MSECVTRTVTKIIIVIAVVLTMCAQRTAGGFGTTVNPKATCSSVFWLLIASGNILVHGKPTVDPGLFMILGVETCRNGTGYCLLGLDCTLDDDFLPDTTGGHCDGLKTAFTPPAYFVCCRYNIEREKITSTKRPRPKPPTTAVSVSEITTDFMTEETTIAPATTTIQPVQDVFMDLNNQVFHEVTPPILNLNSSHNITSQ